MYFFIVVLFWTEMPVSKQCRPWWDIAFCDIWSGSTLFAGMLGTYELKIRNKAANLWNSMFMQQVLFISSAFHMLSQRLQFFEDLADYEGNFLLIIVLPETIGNHYPTSQTTNCTSDLHPVIWAAMTKPTKWVYAQRRLRSAWAFAQSEPLLFSWRNLRSLATHWVHSKDSDQNGRMPRLIWVFAGRTVTLLVLSCCGSFCVKYGQLLCQTNLMPYFYSFFLHILPKFLVQIWLIFIWWHIYNNLKNYVH